MSLQIDTLAYINRLRRLPPEHKLIFWADWVFVMDKGRLIVEGEPQDIFSQRTLLEELDKFGSIKRHILLSHKNTSNAAIPSPK